MMLEFSQYLENYLWPNYSKESEKRSSHAHMMSIVVMINEKFRERVPAWQVGYFDFLVNLIFICSSALIFGLCINSCLQLFSSSFIFRIIYYLEIFKLV